MRYSMLTYICCLAYVNLHSKSPLEQRVPLLTHAKIEGGGITSTQQRGGGGASEKTPNASADTLKKKKKKYRSSVTRAPDWVQLGQLSVKYIKFV